MNRPYGAVDVAANLKGSVPKTAVQKILVALAEKGELVQKVYGEELDQGSQSLVYTESQNTQERQVSLFTINPRSILYLMKELRISMLNFPRSKRRIRPYQQRLNLIQQVSEF